GVRLVGERRLVTGAPLDRNLEPLLRQLRNRLGNDRNTPFAGSSVPRNADPHPRVSLTTRCETSRVTKLVALVAGAFALAAGGAAQDLPSAAHVVLIVLENKDASEINARTAPALTALGLRYGRLTNYFAVTHPSLPDLPRLGPGSTHGITNDCPACSVDGPSIGDQLMGRGRSWAAYAEGFPSGARFAKQHMPFLYFDGAT